MTTTKPASPSEPVHRRAPMVRHHQSKIVFQCGAEESSHFDLEESMIPEGQDAADRWADILARTPWWRPEMREDLRNSVLSMRLKKV